MQKTRYMAPSKKMVQDKKTVIIIASNPGYRMKSFGPKCLLKDKKGVSILEHQISTVKTFYPDCDIIIVGGFECDKISRLRPSYTRVVENQLYEELNDVEDVRLALNNTMGSNAIVIYGDVFFSQNVLNYLKNDSCILVDNSDRMLISDVGCTIVDNHLSMMSLSLEDNKWAKIASFTGKEFKLLKQFVNDRENSRMFLFEAMNYIAEKGGSLKAERISPSHKLVHVDSTKELELI